MTELLEQASLDSPIFKARWKWDAGRSLQLLRFQKGKKIPPQIQRTRSDDLLASVFPQVAACQENIEGDRQIPNHPLIREVMKDVLGEAMDLEGLKPCWWRWRRADALPGCGYDDSIAFAHELLNANPYAFLDDAPLEERRARAVAMRGTVPDSVLGEAGGLIRQRLRRCARRSGRIFAMSMSFTICCARWWLCRRRCWQMRAPDSGRSSSSGWSSRGERRWRPLRVVDTLRRRKCGGFAAAVADAEFDGAVALDSGELCKRRGGAAQGSSGMAGDSGPGDGAISGRADRCPAA